MSRPAKSGQTAGRAGRERVEVIIRLISPYGGLALLGPSVLNVRMQHESAECKLLDVLCRAKTSLRDSPLGVLASRISS
jgi:hypothetical protein